jgi:hypothetical protein
MLNDTDGKCCTQKCLICFFHPSPEELCQLVSHQLVEPLPRIGMSSMCPKREEKTRMAEKWKSLDG